MPLHCDEITGSSPRMRGTHQGWRDDGEVDGIIPAYAGNTLSPRLRAPVRRDHPRVCGEHQSVSVDIDNATGSSPRMRGTRFRRRHVFAPAGIIPAYAGNTVTPDNVVFV